MNVEFADRSFCFTGALVDLKRSAAQREVRARGGLTLNRVNENLDYLVIGAEGSPGWKHGSYGRKIEAARQLRATGHRPELVSESDFMAALGSTPTSNSGDIDRKIVVATHKFKTTHPPSYDRDGLEETLSALQGAGAHVTMKSYPIRAYRELFGGLEEAPDDYVVVEVRMVSQVDMDFRPPRWVADVEKAFESIRGVDGTCSWFERVEGSADYVRLLGEVPQVLRLGED